MHGCGGKTRQQLFGELDAPALSPCPAPPYEYADWKLKVPVGQDYHVPWEGHYYSVPHVLVGSKFNLKATRDSPNCRHCEVNLDQCRAELEAMRQQELQAAHRHQLEQQRQFWPKWASMLSFGGIGGMLLATRMSGALQGWLLWTGIASFLAGLALVRLAE